MGFRELNLFNQALLAKQSWRILRSPDSLVARVLKSKYFREGDFLRAPAESKASFTWRSIVWGRDLFVQGFRWKVGSGKCISIDQDPWIDRRGIFSPIWVNDSLRGRLGCSIRKGDGNWNEELIKEIFCPADAEAILNMPGGSTDLPDEIIWGYDSKGRFSVKSAYRLAVEVASLKEASTSNHLAENPSWKKLWKSDIMPKAKIEVWRIINNAIPTQKNICARGIGVNPMCLFCKSKEELTCHIIWGGKFFRPLWLSYFPPLSFMFSLCKKNWMSFTY